MQQRELYEKIINTTPETINSVETEKLSLHVHNHHYKEYFVDKAGAEHYKLLTYIASLVNDAVILDLGTHIGCSCLALSSNVNNTIHSFDLVNRRVVNQPTNNNHFYIEDILQTENISLFEKANIVMLDTAHEGPFEQAVYEHLQKIDWKGILLLDDIFLNPEMTAFWDGITHEKRDITHLGHFSGTGIVLFN